MKSYRTKVVVRPTGRQWRRKAVACRQSGRSLADPYSVTGLPSLTVWSAPALTVGATLCTVRDSVSLPLAPPESVTGTVTV